MKSLKLFFLAIVCLFAMAATAQNQPQKPQTKAQMNAQKLGTVLYLIENFYVDTANTDKVTEDAIVAALKELDPHSAYISKKDVEMRNALARRSTTNTCKNTCAARKVPRSPSA